MIRSWMVDILIVIGFFAIGYFIGILSQGGVL